MSLIETMVIAILISIGTYFIGLGDGINYMEKQAVKLGYAEHNQTTGEWQWKKKEISNESRNTR